jgi:putative DNA-invertase from lambdoid prophage Rac
MRCPGLVLGVLASVAEFERDLIRERTRLGMERARKYRTRSWKSIGRQRKELPAREAAVKLCAEGKPWREVAAALGCKVWAARRAAA